MKRTWVRCSTRLKKKKRKANGQTAEARQICRSSCGAGEAAATPSRLEMQASARKESHDAVRSEPLLALCGNAAALVTGAAPLSSSARPLRVALFLPITLFSPLRPCDSVSPFF